MPTRARVGALALAPAVSLAAASPALADDHKRMQVTPAEVAAARAAVLRRSDMGPPSDNWEQRVTQPVVTSGPGCGSFRPKQSDLVVTGDVDAVFSRPGLQFDSEAQVLKTARMVRLDWQRVLQSPRFFGCLRSAASKSDDPTRRFVSFERLAFPQITTYTAAYRAVYDVGEPSAKATKLMVDVVFIGRARTEITLTTVAPLSAAAILRPVEIRLARQLAGRIRG